MRKTVLLGLLLVWIGSFYSYSGNPVKGLPEFPQTGKSFLLANDLGRNGYYEQKPIARLMGEVAGAADVEFIAAAGDVHHFAGVAGVQDPLWMTNYELIYDHPELMIDWHVILGNHEYRGNTQAVLDYSAISRRWNAPNRYYTQRLTVGDNATCLLVFIDTTPLIGKYRKDTEAYPDVAWQDEQKQLQWIDSVLVHSNDTWKIVIGHHPVYAETKKSAEEREDLQVKLASVFEKTKVNVYFCGHIHNFQHIRPAGKKVEYVVNSSASLARSVKPIEGTKFCSPDAGFTVCHVDTEKFEFFFVNGQGEVIYRYPIVKE